MIALALPVGYPSGHDTSELTAHSCELSDCNVTRDPDDLSKRLLDTPSRRILQTCPDYLSGLSLEADRRVDILLHVSMLPELSWRITFSICSGHIHTNISSLRASAVCRKSDISKLASVDDGNSEKTGHASSSICVVKIILMCSVITVRPELSLSASTYSTFAGFHSNGQSFTCGRDSSSNRFKACREVSPSMGIVLGNLHTGKAPKSVTSKTCMRDWCTVFRTLSSTLTTTFTTRPVPKRCRTQFPSSRSLETPNLSYTMSSKG
mmetsp:Transcript_72823/g.173496  ORF Transcript_72823/g.173496 Transcript_72823/m.173496 type:complete len:265 (+) Transcript_72823:45-839(+)